MNKFTDPLRRQKARVCDAANSTDNDYDTDVVTRAVLVPRLWRLHWRRLHCELAPSCHWSHLQCLESVRTRSSMQQSLHLRHLSKKNIEKKIFNGGITSSSLSKQSKAKKQNKNNTFDGENRSLMVHSNISPQPNTHYPNPPERKSLMMHS